MEKILYSESFQAFIIANEQDANVVFYFFDTIDLLTQFLQGLINKSIKSSKLQECSQNQQS